MAKVARLMTVVMTAKAKFKSLLNRKYQQGLASYQEFKEKQRKEGLRIVDKQHSLKDLHPVAKTRLINSMKFHRLRKGDTFKLHNFPAIDFTLVAEGRMEVQWY